MHLPTLVPFHAYCFTILVKSHMGKKNGYNDEADNGGQSDHHDCAGHIGESFDGIAIPFRSALERDVSQGIQVMTPGYRF
jgi:hypothetical protein